MYLLLLFSIIPNDEITIDTFDKCVINSFYDEKCNLCFDQLIFYDFDNEACRFRVEAWKILKDCRMDKSNPNYENLEKEWVLRQYKEHPGEENAHKRAPFTPPWLGSSMVPVYDPQTGKYSSIFKDGDYIRKITVKQLEELHSFYDPELEDREFFPKQKRRDLLIPKRGGR